MTPSRIHILPSELADQIAAGEVVERPASVVKELVENSLDAGSGRIEVEVGGGGRALLRISDDGCGMTPDEAHLALKRHATSKLSAFEQLSDLRTMGFRGEALPSIAAVSRFSLTTRTADSIEGHRLTVEGGIEGEARAAGAPRGTQIEVRDLFYNVPARLKFLKADATETAHVTDTVTRLALAHPEVHFRLRTDGGTKPVLDLPPHRSVLERATAALSRRGPIHLHFAQGAESGVQVTACLAAPPEAGNTTRNTYVFVNRRFVRDRALLQALVMGYGELIERGRYPFAAVFIEMPPGTVDVNVHPQKTEVRFVKPQEVHAAVRHVVRAACARAPWLAEPAEVRVYHLPPERPPIAQKQAEQSVIDAALALFAPRPARPFTASASPALGAATLAARADDGPDEDGHGPDERTSPGSNGASSGGGLTDGQIRASAAEATGFFSSLRYMGQIHRTYLVCEGSGELVLIDQHAAHERVAFERLKVAHDGQGVRNQRLLFPHVVDLDEAQAAAAIDHGEVLASLGFEIDALSGRSFAVKAAPEILREGPTAEVLRDLLDELSARGATEVVAERLDHLFATMACHSVVRAGDVLDDARVRALLDSMDGIDFRAHCPHGRPVLLRMSIGELERRFGRT